MCGKFWSLGEKILRFFGLLGDRFLNRDFLTRKQEIIADVKTCFNRSFMGRKFVNWITWRIGWYFGLARGRFCQFWARRSKDLLKKGLKISFRRQVF